MNSLPFQKSADFISAWFERGHHDIAIVLGSGLGGFTKHLTDKTVLGTDKIPDYPRSTVPGHIGEIVSARLAEKSILIFGGRVHYYETGSTVDAAVTAIVSHHLGIRTLVLTNAAGILNEKFYPGDLMVIRDQINLTSRNVLLDMKMQPKDLNPIYSKELVTDISNAAEQLQTNLRSGIYLGLTGPSYETPSEVKFYRSLRGDAVGMSTIHEALFARYAGMRVLGISCLTNYSTGLTSKKLSHREVTRIGLKVDERFSQLLLRFIERV